MKLLFVHDHPFYQENYQEIYSGGAFPSLLWSNYLMNFDQILVFGRKSYTKDSKIVLSSRNNVRFFLTENYSSIKSFFKNCNKLRRELLNCIEDKDVVLVRLPSILGFFAAIIALSKGKKIWVEQVGSAQEAFSSYGTFFGRCIAPFLEYLNKIIVCKADFVTYVTQSKLQRDYPASSGSLEIDLSDVIVRKIISLDCLQEERFNSPVIKIGVIGGFDVRYKGQDILLKAINLLPEDMKEKIELYFVGKGNFKWLEEIAISMGLKKNIKYIGPLEAGDEINNFLKTLSLYVQPSLTEGLPRATIEAMSMGCPVIGSNVGGIPDIVSSDLIHEKGNVKQLALSMQKLLENRKLLYMEAKRSIEKAKPYLKQRLDAKRKLFYQKMNQRINSKI